MTFDNYMVLTNTSLTYTKLEKYHIEHFSTWYESSEAILTKVLQCGNTPKQVVGKEHLSVHRSKVSEPLSLSLCCLTWTYSVKARNLRSLGSRVPCSMISGYDI